jgi:hypothetical protein
MGVLGCPADDQTDRTDNPSILQYTPKLPHQPKPPTTIHEGVKFSTLEHPNRVPLSARMRRVLATAISIYRNLLPSHVCFGHDRSSLARAWSSTPQVHFDPGSWHSCPSSASQFCFCSFRAESLSMSCPLGFGGPSSRSPPGSLHFVWRCRRSLGSSPLEFHMGEGSSRALPTNQPPPQSYFMWAGWGERLIPSAHAQPPKRSVDGAYLVSDRIHYETHFEKRLSEGSDDEGVNV